MKRFAPVVAILCSIAIVAMSMLPCHAGAGERKSGNALLRSSAKMPVDPVTHRLNLDLERARTRGDLSAARVLQSAIDQRSTFDPATTAEYAGRVEPLLVSQDRWDGMSASGVQNGAPLPAAARGSAGPLWGSDVTVASGFLMGTPAATESPYGDLYVGIVNYTTHHNYYIYRSLDGGHTWGVYFDSYSIADSINYLDIEYVAGPSGMDSVVIVRDGWSGGTYSMKCVVTSTTTGSNVLQTTIATNSGAYRDLRLETDNINYTSGVFLYLVYNYNGLESSFRRSTDFDTTWSGILTTVNNAVNPDLAYGRASDGTSGLYWVAQQGTAPFRDIVLKSTQGFGTDAWYLDTLTVSGYDDFDPHIAVANGDSTRIIVNTHNYANTGDLDIWYAFTMDDGTTWNIQYGLDVTTDTTSKAVIAEDPSTTRFYRCAYVREAPAGNDLLYTSSNTVAPTWGTEVAVNDFDVAGWNSTGNTRFAQPDIASCSGNGRVFYVRWDGYALFMDGWEFTVDVADRGHVPLSFALEQNYPNPFNPRTVVRYQLPVAGHVQLKVFDILGREVTTLVNDFRGPGRYEIQFDASSLASGVYFYRLTTDGFTRTMKMALVR